MIFWNERPTWVSKDFIQTYIDKKLFITLNAVEHLKWNKITDLSGYSFISPVKSVIENGSWKTDWL